MDRGAIKEKLYGLVSQSVRDGVSLAVRMYSACGIDRTADDEAKWAKIQGEINDFNEGFEKLEDGAVSDAEALAAVAQSAESLVAIADQLDGDRPRHTLVGQRMRDAATRLTHAVEQEQGLLL